jgi:hypothetical protein
MKSGVSANQSWSPFLICICVPCKAAYSDELRVDRWINIPIRYSKYEQGGITSACSFELSFIYRVFYESMRGCNGSSFFINFKLGIKLFTRSETLNQYLLKSKSYGQVYSEKMMKRIKAIFGLLCFIALCVSAIAGIWNFIGNFTTEGELRGLLSMLLLLLIGWGCINLEKEWKHYN